MSRKLWIGLVTCCLAGAWAVSPACGQVNVEVGGGGTKVQVGGVNVDVGGPAKVHYDAVFRASSTMGMPVKNDAGEDIGKINDLVMGLHSGNVRFAVLSYGGIGGIGDKLFAVPFEKLQLTFGEDDKHFVLPVPAEKLNAAEGFDQNNWPNTTDEWAATAEALIAGEKRGSADKSSGEGTNAEQGDPSFRVSKLQGIEVRDAENKGIGKLDDLVVDLQSGQVRYGALAFGQTFGFGGKLFAIPWNRLGLYHEGDYQFVVLNVPYETLKEAPGFDKENWPDTASQVWQDELDQFYGERDQKASE